MYMYVYKYFIKSKYSKLLNIPLTNIYVAVFVFKYGIHYQATWDNPPIPAKVNRTSLFSTGDSVSHFCKILFAALFLQIENINDVKYGNDIYLQFSRFHGLLVFFMQQESQVWNYKRPMGQNCHISITFQRVLKRTNIKNQYGCTLSFTLHCIQN